MPKGVEQQQLANAGTGQQLSNQLTANAANVYGGLEPALSAEAAHPTGYTPTQKANIDTAAQQSAGGSTAAAVGQGGLYAARTRNAGAGQAAIGNSVRSAGGNLSRSAVGTQVQDANLANANRNHALGGLASIGGEELGTGVSALGASNQALSGAAGSKANDPWLQLYLQAQSNVRQASAAAGGE
jgi:hypothetical protein